MLASSNEWMVDDRAEGFGRPATHRRPETLKVALLFSVAALGACLPHFLPLDLSRHYQAEARLELGSHAGDDGSRAALVKAAADGLKSPALLDAVARRIGIAGDNRLSAEAPTAMGLLSDIVSRQEVTASSAEATARLQLSNALSISDPGGRTLGVVARDDNSLAAATVANAAADILAKRLSDERAVGETDAVKAARAALEATQTEVETLKVTPDEMRIFEEVRDGQAALTAEDQRLQGARQALQARIGVLSQLTLDDVLAKPLPAELESSGLEALRRKHVDAKLLVDQLSGDLGPRHPRLIAAAAAETEARQSLAKAMQKLTAASRQEEASLAKDIDDLKARTEKLAATQVPENARRKIELEAKLDNARQTYLDAVRDVDARPVTPSDDIRLVSPASPATAIASGWPGWIYSLAGALAALCLTGALLPARRSTVADDGAEADLAADNMLSINDPRHDTDGEFDEVPDLLAFAGLPALQLPEPDRVQPEPLSQPVARVPVMPSFDEYCREERLSRQADHIATDDELDSDPLEQLLLAIRQPPSSDRPLPQLLAAIMAGQPGQDVVEPAPVEPEPIDEEAEAAERALAELRQSIALLRMKVANQLPETEEWAAEPRYAMRR